MNIRKLPIGIQNFEDLRKNHYMYVDKTAYIWELVQNGKAYFLSRPRRFGKSLLLSTFEAYFEGKKDLFKDLKIESLEEKKGNKAWQKYPVVKFSLSGGNYNDPDGLRGRLEGTVNECARSYSLNGEYAVMGLTLPDRFLSLLKNLYLKYRKTVVVLVDEYDKPLLETMNVNHEQEEKNRQFYKGFFSILKDADQYLKFVFFTGVTKFSKVSVFSDLNQLRDISLSEMASAMCGITDAEIVKMFTPEIAAMAKEQEMTVEECRQRLSETYDGYHFSKKAEGVYNPFSLLNAFADKDFGSYWFSTGTPTFLIHKLQKSGIRPEQLEEGIESTEAEMMDSSAENSNPVPLLYQAGYLTIDGFDKEFRMYRLRFPNDEVRYGFLNSLVPSVLGDTDAESPYSIRSMILSLRKGDIGRFMDQISSLFASVPYLEGKAGSADYENIWRNQIYLVLKLLGQNVVSEPHTARGRCDCVIKTSRFIYLFEFKMDGNADKALRQIDEKGYAEPYSSDNRKIIKVGVNFSSEKKNIGDWKSCEIGI